MNIDVRLGDNLAIMKEMDDDSVDLISTDPPYATQQNFGDFDDRWKSVSEFVDFMRPRVLEMRRILKPTGAFYQQCDDHASHHLRIMLDEIFGPKNFRNEIIWKRTSGGKNNIRNRFIRSSDRILFYAGSKHKFNMQYHPLNPETIEKNYARDDGDGRGPYSLGNIVGPGGYEYEFMGVEPPKGGYSIKESTMQELYDDGRLLMPSGKRKRITKKVYLDGSKGIPMSDFWEDIPWLSPGDDERCDYDTQKPVALYERIIRASSNEGEVVLDPFCGSGTTLIAARNLGRIPIGIDINEQAVEMARSRMVRNEEIGIQKDFDF